MAQVKHSILVKDDLALNGVNLHHLLFCFRLVFPAYNQRLLRGTSAVGYVSRWRSDWPSGSGVEQLPETDLLNVPSQAHATVHLQWKLKMSCILHIVEKRRIHKCEREEKKEIHLIASLEC